MLHAKRLMFPLVLCLGAAFLFFSSRSGLWDPWEMDRAHVARQIAGKPKVLVAEGGSALFALLEQGDARGLHLVPTGIAPSEGEVPGALGDDIRVLKMAEAALRGETFHAVFIEAELVAAEGDDTREGRTALTRNLALLQSFEDLAPGTELVLLGKTAESCQQSTTALERAVVRQSLGMLDSEYKLLPEGVLKGEQAEEQVENLVREKAGTYPFVLDIPCVVAEEGAVASLASSLSGRPWARVFYKGFVEPSTTKTRTPALATYFTAPLDYWLTAASFRVFGFSEFATRLPGLLLGFLTLLAFGLLVRGLAGESTALIAPLVLVTLPMFLGQSKSLAGEISYTLFLTLSVGLFGLMAKKGSSLPRLAGFLAACALLFLAKGLFGLLVLGLVIWGFVAVTGAWKRRDLLIPAGIWLGAFVVLVFLVQWPSEWTFFHHFKFMNRPFEGGPILEHRTFEYFVRATAFAWLPWTLIMPFAVVRLLPLGGDRDSSDGMSLRVLTFLWFSVPFVAHTAMFQDFLHASLPTATALALAVGLLWGRLEAAGKVNRFQAVILAIIAVILLSNLATSPEPLLSFLTWDPAFSAEGSKFPADFALGYGGLAVLGAIALVLFWYYISGGTLFKRVARFFQGGSAFWAVFLVLLTGLVFRLAVGLVFRMGEGLGRQAEVAADEVARMMPAWFDYARWMLVVLGVPAVVLLVWGVFNLRVVREWVLGGWNRLIDSLGALGRLKRRSLSALGRGLSWLSSRWVLAAAALAVAVASVVNMAVSLQRLAAEQAGRPEMADQVHLVGGWLGGLFARQDTLFALCLAALAVLVGVGLLVFRKGKAGPGASLVWRGVWSVMVLSMLVCALHLYALTDMRSVDIPILVVAAMVLWTLDMMVASRQGFPSIVWGVLVLLVFAGTTVFAAGGGSLLHLESVAWPGQSKSYLSYLLVGSRVTGILMAGVVLVLVNVFLAWTGRRWAGHAGAKRWIRRLTCTLPAAAVAAPDLASTDGSPAAELTASTDGSPAAEAMTRLEPTEVCLLPTRWPEALQLRPVALTLTMILALGFAGFYALRFLPSFARQVSQKHIIELYHAAEGREDLGDDLFKYQKAGDRKEDRNFYTASIPGINNQNDLIQLLLPAEDRVYKVSRSPSDPGPSHVLVQGFDPANDANGDGQRDNPADAGLASAAEGVTVEDLTKNWTPGQWKGMLFLDWREEPIQVADNGPHTLTLEGPHAMESSRPERMRYALSHPQSVSHKASAMSPSRTYIIMDQESFSSLNFSFRAKSQGKHIPVLDGSNTNFLLAVSDLRQGEINHNRFARHTLTHEEFKAVPGMKGGWVNFDDKVKFLGYTINSESPGRNSKVTLKFYFECTGKIPGNWKVFVHMDSVGSSNRINGDHWPLNMTEDPEEKGCIGCWRTNHWLEGDIIIDEFTREIPLGSPTGRHQINFGFYQPGSDERLKVIDWDRTKVRYNPSDKDRVTVGTFEVH